MGLTGEIIEKRWVRSDKDLVNSKSAGVNDEVLVGCKDKVKSRLGQVSDWGSGLVRAVWSFLCAREKELIGEL